MDKSKKPFNDKSLTNQRFDLAFVTDILSECPNKQSQDVSMSVLDVKDLVGALNIVFNNINGKLCIRC